MRFKSWKFVLAGLLVQVNARVSTVTSYAALGDSYAAGDGAGSSRLLPHFGSLCGRFSESYPVQVANSTRLSIEDSAFRNLACGGASSVSVLKTQVALIGDSDIVTITVGGNEVDFFVILNACVHQWWPSAPCDYIMTQGRRKVQSGVFLDRFNSMVVGAMSKLKPGARLYVTGYARFFNDQTDQCDRASFSRRDPTNFLTKDIRRKFNQMVDLLNDVIRAASEANEAIYIDIDKIFEGHRFCEEGVVEPSNRENTWFFNIQYDQKETLLHERDIQTTLTNPIGDFVDLTKTFHPTSLGHEAIAKEIVDTVIAS